MDSTQRKRFKSPFSAGATIQLEGDKYLGDFIFPKTSSLSSEPRSGVKRALEKDFESIIEGNPRQKICRSLFTNFNAFEEHCRRDSSESVDTDVKNPVKYRSFLDLQVPKVLQESDIENSTNCQKIMEELLEGSVHEMKEWDPFNLSELLKDEFIKKVQMTITPLKIPSPGLRNPDVSLIEYEDLQKTPLQMTSPRTMLVGKKEDIIEEDLSRISISLPTRSISQEISSGKKGKLIKGCRVFRCGRIVNQPYDEQAKEFQAILSSKVRQIAEVTDCMHHKELLYQILQL